jgi:hypothetical protein
MQQDNGMGGLEQELAGYEAMGPDGYKQLTGMGTLDARGQLARQSTQDQMGLLSQQYAQAQNMSQPKGRNFGTVGGNVASGLGDILGAFAGGRRMSDIQGQQQALQGQGAAQQAGILDQQDAGRLNAGNARFEAMKNFMAKQQQPQPPAGSPMGMGPGAGGAANFQMAQLRNPLLGQG